MKRIELKREPREMGVIAAGAALLLAVTLAVPPVAAQVVTGTLGSPHYRSQRESTPGANP
jgi:hypothetical protein